MKSKLAIIIAGGGMRSSFSAGVMDALVRKYKISEPFLLICGSGSVGTGAYYLARQYDVIRSVWTKLMSSKKVLNRWRFWKVVDIDYVVDVIFKKKKPLLKEKFYKSRTKYLMALLNKDTGKVSYLDNRKKGDIFEKIRAAKAVPLAFKLNPSVKINGKNYCDSVASANPYMHIKKAVESGANKILIIENHNPLEEKFGDIAYFFWVLLQGFGKSYYSAEKKMLKYKTPKKIKTFAVKPRKNIQITTFNNERSLLRKTFKQGYRETIFNKKLKLFLKK